MDYIDQIKAEVEHPERVDILTEEMIWQRHGPLIWQADKFEGMPNYYPVYRWRDYYSYSLLALIVKKGNLSLNNQAVEKANGPGFVAQRPDMLIDKDIERIGGPLYAELEINDPDDYLHKLAEAMTEDIHDTERLNPGYTNIVMCGGKDSLNILLLPFKNPVVAISADPNFPLVCQFVKNNQLGIEVIRLEDTYDAQFLDQEKLECACRMDLAHWKWGLDISNIARRFDNKVIFWKGQSGEIRVTDIWKKLVLPETPLNEFTAKAFKKLSLYLPKFCTHYYSKKRNWSARQRNWLYSSAKLGCHLGFIRSLTSSLALSPYCGPKVLSLFKRTDLARTLYYDRRADYGKILFGRDVWYPDINPGPPLSAIRQGAHAPEKFTALLDKNGIAVK